MTHMTHSHESLLIMMSHNESLWVILSHYESYIRIFIGEPYNIDLNRFYHLVKIPTAVRNDGISYKNEFKMEIAIETYTYRHISHNFTILKIFNDEIPTGCIIRGWNFFFWWIMMSHGESRSVIMSHDESYICIFISWP